MLQYLACKMDAVALINGIWLVHAIMPEDDNNLAPRQGSKAQYRWEVMNKACDSKNEVTASGFSVDIS